MMLQQFVMRSKEDVLPSSPTFPGRPAFKEMAAIGHWRLGCRDCLPSPLVRSSRNATSPSADDVVCLYGLLERCSSLKKSSCGLSTPWDKRVDYAAINVDARGEWSALSNKMLCFKR